MDGSVSVCSGDVSPAASRLSSPELEAELLTLTGHLNAATYRWLMLLAEFDTRKGLSKDTFASRDELAVEFRQLLENLRVAA